MKSLFNYVLKALMLSVAFSGFAACMDVKKQLVYDIVKQCKAQRAPQLFSGVNREHFSDVVLLAEAELPTVNIKAWFLLAAYETKTQDLIWQDPLLQHVLFPKKLRFTEDVKERETYPDLNEVLRWYMRYGHALALLEILHCVGSGGKTFPIVVDCFLNDKEILNDIVTTSDHSYIRLFAQLAKFYDNAAALEILDPNEDEDDDTTPELTYSSSEESDLSDDVPPVVPSPYLPEE